MIVLSPPPLLVHKRFENRVTIEEKSGAEQARMMGFHHMLGCASPLCLHAGGGVLVHAPMF